MENDKVYLLLTRNNNGAYTEKVKVFGDLYFCKTVLNSMMRTSPKNIRGEIIEGDREWIMDFRVRPIAKFKIAEDGHFVEDN
jgi:hypothetical protein